MNTDIENQFIKTSLELSKLRDLVWRDGTEEQVWFLRQVMESLHVMKEHIQNNPEFRGNQQEGERE